MVMQRKSQRKRLFAAGKLPKPHVALKHAKQLELRIARSLSRALEREAGK